MSDVESNEVINEVVVQTGPTIIEVANPTAEEMVSLQSGIKEQLKVNHDFDVDVLPVKFNFKKTKDKDTGLILDRKPVELALPYASVTGIVAILEGGEPGNNKGLDLLIEAMKAIVNSAAREILHEDTTLTAATFPVERVSWEHIANIPKVQRMGNGIPKETWDAFTIDYIAVMPEVTGKTVEAVTNAAKILANKLSSVKTNEKVLELLVGQLALYADNSANIEEFAECVEFLADKADKLLNVSEEELLSALM